MALTPRLQLILPGDPDAQDIDQLNANFNTIDKNVGFEQVTSTTRPTGSDRYLGKLIRETDTKALRTWDGTDWVYIGGGATSAVEPGSIWHQKIVNKGTWQALVRRMRINDSALLISGHFLYNSGTGTSLPAQAAYNSIVDGWGADPDGYPDWCKTNSGQTSTGTSMGTGVISGGGENASYHYSIDNQGGISARVQTTLTVVNTKAFYFGPVMLFRS